MTIFKPHTSAQIRKFIFIFSAVLLMMGGMYIFEYTRLADTRYQIQSLKERMTALESQNADLKSQVFTIADPVHLEQAALAANLILERRPEYLRNNQWLSDSSY